MLQVKVNRLNYIYYVVILRVYNVHIDKISKDRYNVVKLSLHMFTP